MQRYCTELTERLLKSLDKEYNVVDMGAVVDVISTLEKTTITKEVLEVTRLGKFINELRRKTSNDALAKRAKDLVRRWRDMVLPSSHSTPQPTPADPAPQALNGTKPQSPALWGLKPHSPAGIRPLKPHSPSIKAPLKPQSPLLRDSTAFRQLQQQQQVVSPVSALHSDRSRSPNSSSTRHQESSLSVGGVSTSKSSNHRPSLSPRLAPVPTHNHNLEAVPRTHSSNKRLRKEDTGNSRQSSTSPAFPGIHENDDSRQHSRFEPASKRARLNGETTTSTTLTTSTTALPTVSDNSETGSGRWRTPNLNSTSTINQQVPNSRHQTEITRERLHSAEETSASPDIGGAGPKKRGRKKGSKSLKNQTLPEDRVKEKLASISRNPKLKTTQELLADLQARGASANFPSAGSTTTGTTTVRNASTPMTPTTTTGGTTIATTISSRGGQVPTNNETSHRNPENEDRVGRGVRTKREKNENLEARKNRQGNARSWQRSKRSDDEDYHEKYEVEYENEEEEDDDEDDDEDEENDSTRDNRVAGPGGGGATRDLTVEDILAKLPPLDRDAISWSDDEDGEAIGDQEGDPDKREERIITDKDIERLHDMRIEGLNGNFQYEIPEKSPIEKEITIQRFETDGKDPEKRKSVDGVAADGEPVFREWHEMLARPSYQGQTLHILPYVIID